MDINQLEVLVAVAREKSFSRAAEVLNRTQPAVSQAIRRLEQEGYILGYRAIVNPTRLGLPHVAFVEVRLSDTRKAALEAFNKAVRALPEVEQAHMIASSFDYLLKGSDAEAETITLLQRQFTDGVTDPINDVTVTLHFNAADAAALSWYY